MPNTWINPIYDRTQEDVDKLKDYNARGYFNLTPEEQLEWLTNLKGALNQSDLERIENDIQILSGVLELDLTTYVGNIPEFPTVSYYKNLRDNVEAIRAYRYRHPETPLTPIQPLNHFTKINDIEHILNDVYTILNQSLYYWCESPSQIYCGEGVGLLL